MEEISASADADTQPGAAKTVADVLAAAADLIEPEGAWTQGSYGHQIGAGEFACLCLYGAICETAHGGDQVGPGSYRLEDGAYDAVRKLVGENPIDWNDAPGRTQAEVVAALRAAAETARTADADKRGGDEVAASDGVNQAKATAAPSGLGGGNV